MRIVITGASGNVGTALLRRLQSDPAQDHQVVGVVRRRPQSVAPYDDVEWVTADLASADVRVALDEALEGADAVVHLAWGFQPARDTDYLDRVGIAGTRELVRAADAAGVEHLVHMSSVGAYSGAITKGRVTEAWPTEGVPSLAYSRAKAEVERLLDEYDGRGGGMVVTRLRPGLVLQRDAASSLLRYGLPGYLPRRLVSALPVLPLDASLRIQVVHADDVADAIVRALEQRVSGAFNLAAEPVIGRQGLAAALEARPLPMPRAVLRAVIGATWHARLHALDPGWIDLAFDTPLMDTTRARTELGWDPRVSATDALDELVRGMRDGANTLSPVLRSRRVVDRLSRLVRSGGIGSRRLP
ncbi:NAD-dependent epimerase/dehydratase family protein [Nocardioides bigeumensis]|uniref:NAD-dependent epimerase/dehydratase family protein n=1 Tax=Nocardioides bigeumensis TaxID=433657 RepID=A0ABP5K995_9ACTN